MNDRDELRTTLQEQAAQEIPDTIDLWPSLRLRVRARQKHTAYRRVPQVLVGVAVLLVFFVLTFDGVATALSPALDRLLQSDPGLNVVEQAQLGTPLHLHQRHGDMTAELVWGYADINRVIVAYRLQTASGRKVELDEPRLQTQDGIVLPPLVGRSVNGESEDLGLVLPPGEAVTVMSFDAAPVADTPQALNLRLTIEVGVPTVGAGDSEPIPNTFTFDFEMPFVEGRTMVLKEPIQDKDVTITLDRVVITPSYKRIVVCFTPIEPGKTWIPRARLTQPDGTYSGEDITYTIENGCSELHFSHSVAETAGNWTLEIRELTPMLTVYVDDAQAYEPLQGNWRWSFTLAQ